MCIVRQWPKHLTKMATGDHTRGTGYLLRGRRVAIVGYGAIGAQTAEMLLGLGARVLVVSSRAGRLMLPPGMDSTSDMEKAFSSCDVVSLHVRRDRANERMINAESLSWMPPGSFLVNTARQELLDESAVADALLRGHLAGAALDDMPLDPRLRSAPNLLTFPHLGNRTHEGMRSVALQVLENLRNVALGKEPRYVVAG
jgi:D-3-phosphoglycerate dehydrogenase